MNMVELSKAEQEALHSVYRILAKKRYSQKKNHTQIENFMILRQRAAKDMKQKILNQMSHAVGINADDLLKRQKRDGNAVIAFLSKQKQELLDEAKDINHCHTITISKQWKQWNHALQHHSHYQQSITAALNEAALIHLSCEGESSISPNENLACIRALVTSGGHLGGLLKENVANIDWMFVWTSPRNGLLDVTSLLTMNGASTLFTNSTCDSGFSASNVNVTVTLSQGQVQDYCRVKLFDATVRSPWGDSLGAINFIALNESDTVSYKPAQFPVMADTPVVITITVSLYVLVNNGQAELDFMSGDFRLNVPYVFLQLL